MVAVSRKVIFISFLYPFFTLLQPGILWPEIAELRPLIILVAAGTLIGLRLKSDYPRRLALRHPMLLWLLAFVVVQSLSVNYSGPKTMLDEFLWWMVYPLFVVVSILLIPNIDALRRYVWGMILGGMFLVGFGICAVMYAWPEAEGGRAAAYGIYANSNDYTFVIILILPFILLFRAVEPNIIRRQMLAVFFVTCIVGVFLSLSRGGILALLLELTMIVAITVQGKRRVLLLSVLALVAAAAIPYQFAAREQSDQTVNYTAEDSQNSRIELWRAGKSILEQRPLLGIGSRRFIENSKEYAELSHRNIGLNPHNTYVDIAATSGFLGFFAFAFSIYSLLRELHRNTAEGLNSWLVATRSATIVSLYSILFRANFDAKSADWSFYFLCTIGLACALLIRHSRSLGLSRANTVDRIATDET